MSSPFLHQDESFRDHFLGKINAEILPSKMRAVEILLGFKHHFLKDWNKSFSNQAHLFRFQLFKHLRIFLRNKKIERMQLASQNDSICDF